MTEHTLIGLHPVDKNSNAQFLAECSCGEIISPARGLHWNIVSNEDGTVTLTPSIDASNSGHFHSSNPVITRWLH